MEVSGLLGAGIGSFLGMTVLLFGAAAILTGQALARNWRPAWHIVPSALLLGIGDRFLLFALFQAQLLSASGYAAAVAILLALCFGAYRLTLARRMVMQYPWLYERTGPFRWRAKA